MKTFFICCAALLMTGSVYSQNIQLNTPDKTRGSVVMKALADRHSDREFSEKELSTQDLSDLLWAANGINRADGKRTAASARNVQDVGVYVFMAKGAYLYDYKANALNLVAAGDHRALVGAGQGTVDKAPVMIVLVTNLTRFGKIDDHARTFGAFDCGLVSQNIALFCSGCGLSTVPRATMKIDEIKKLLHLSENELPIINNPVGYPKQ